MMRLNPAEKACDQMNKISSRISFQVKPRELQKRISSYPFLCSDTYLAKCERVILTQSDIKKLIDEDSATRKFKTVYLAGDLVEHLLEFKVQIPDIETLVVMESDITQYEQKLSKLYSKVDKIFSNNLVGKSKRCFPVPLGIERQAYRSAGRLSNFKKKYETKINKRPIPFLIAWNDATNTNRPIYRSEFQNNSDSLVINQRVHASTIHKLMRKTMFVPSPAGNGIDCHRTWEALYLGAVPVVLRSEYFGESNWPVLVVDSWSELLAKKSHELNDIYIKNALDQKQAIQFGVNILEKIFGATNE